MAASPSTAETVGADPGAEGPSPPPAWTAATLEVIFARTAEAHPERTALVDAPDRAEWNGGSAPLTLSYGEARRRAETIALAFRRLGLQPGDVLALHAPNTIETVLVLLAAWRAGLVVAPIPPLWRKRDALGRLKPLAPKAIVTTGRIGDAPVGEWARAISTGIPSLRLKLGFGAGLPDGVVPLDRIAEVTSHDEAPPAPPDRRISTITFADDGPEGAPQYHARGDAHWLAAGLEILLEAGIPTGASGFVPFSLTGLAGIGAGLVPWLISGGTLHLHQFRDHDRLVRHALKAEPDWLVAPGRVSVPLLAAFDRRLRRPPSILISVLKGAEVPPASSGSDSWSRPRHVDAVLVGELALAALRREGTEFAGLPLGRLTAPHDAPDGPVLFESRLDGMPQKAGDRGRPVLGGLVAVRGPMVPMAGPLDLGRGVVDSGLAAGPQGFVRSPLVARLVEGIPLRLMPDGLAGDVAAIGGVLVGLAELDALYRSVPSFEDAAALALPGPSGRRRIVAAVVPRAGRPFDADALLVHLEAQSVARHHMPAEVIAVEMIPRNASGATMRDVLAERLLRN